MKRLVVALVLLAAACSGAAPVEAPAQGEGYRTRVLATIAEAEQYRAYPYPDRGHWSIGYGRNLTVHGVSPREAWFLLENDVDDAIRDLHLYLPGWHALNAPRQAALVEMSYNLGIGGLLDFKRMLAALRHEQWGLAEREALDSLWAKQVGGRAVRLARQLRTGTWIGQ